MKHIAVSATADGDGADGRLDEVVGQLQQNGSEKTKFFIGQLRTAAQILTNRLRR